ncbi:VMAP-C domain-containing protein [Actinoallomurus acaciae]|uniref:TIR domain-containing protein n=1 Tax=Actinoallomurus acaciae TaxID=502577 RepID=A0ABV5YUX0_9ACTN
MVDEGERSSALARRSPHGGGRRQYGHPEQTTADIVEILSGIRELHEEAGRSILVHAIGEMLGEPLMLASYPNPRYFLYYLVLACHDHPAGLTALVRSVEFVAGQTVAAARLRRLVSPAQDLLEPAVETRIEDLLMGLRVRSLARLYYAAAGGSVAPAPRQFSDAWDAFSVLLDHNRSPDRPPPHLAFVAMLLQMLRARDPAGPDEARRRTGLREWMTIELGKLRDNGETGHADHLEQLRDRSEPTGADQPIYLIIQLEPVPDLVEGGTMCRLSHWRQVDPLGWRPEPGEDRVVPFKEVPEHVAELIQEAEGGWAYQFDDSLVLEFVLPLELINLSLDEWTRDPPETPHPTPLGTEYEVLVRSYERLHTRNLHRAWRQRWQRLVDAVACATYWAGDPDSAQRMRDRLHTEREIVACVLSGPPDREPGATELRMALRAGIPVVLWHRMDESDAELRELLREYVGRPDLVGLPQDIKRLRGSPPSERLAREKMQLTLLWDDPTHFIDDPEVLRHPGHQYGRG